MCSVQPLEMGCFLDSLLLKEAERVFSLLEAMFGKDQDASLSDMIQGALMLRYNKRTVG